MNQEPQKNNTVLIIIAIIGVVGTIIAATIGAIGNYNTEKLRQNIELTRIALVSINMQSGTTQASPTVGAIPSLTTTATNTPIPTGTPVLLLKSIAGIWTGIDEGTVGGNPVPGREIEVTVLADCSIENVCGTATSLVNNVLCVKSLTLIEIKDETYMFEGTIKEGSGSFCGEGGSIILKPMPDGTLSYALDSYNSSGELVKKTAILNLR